MKKKMEPTGFIGVTKDIAIVNTPKRKDWDKQPTHEVILQKYQDEKVVPVIKKTGEAIGGWFEWLEKEAAKIALYGGVIFLAIWYIQKKI